MDVLGIISGTIPGDKGLFREAFEEVVVENDFGKATVLRYDRFLFLPRHGRSAAHYILPHAINHQANLTALKELGVRQIIGVCSTGSLKKEIPPGTTIVPDDFISISDPPTVFTKTMAHKAPSLSKELRDSLIVCAEESNVDVLSKGTYWQSRGPRFETKAEIQMMAHFADIVGMTMAGEATIASELEMPYAALCSVDNYGHGIVEEDLEMEEVISRARSNSENVIRILTRYLERMRK